MLSTPKALRHFEGVVDLLAQIKAHADARPAQPVPQDLQLQLYNALQAIKSGFAAPGAVWTELLRQKVRSQLVVLNPQGGTVIPCRLAWPAVRSSDSERSRRVS